MRKKRLIIISIILSVFAVMIVLASTVFMLSSVKVDIVTKGNQIISEKDADGIIKKAKFNYGGNILFMDFSKQIARIELAFPYAKVEKIERKFPNKAVVHISERTPAAYVKSGEFIYILDKELKVLNVLYATDFNETNEALPASAMLVPEIELEIEKGTSSGQVVDNEFVKNILQNVVLGLGKLNKKITELTSIDVHFENSKLRLEISVHNNEMKLLVKGENDLATKVQVGIKAFFDHIAEYPGATGILEQVQDDDISFVKQS